MAISGLRKSEGSSERDFLTLEKANGFFCHACLVDVHNYLMSPDPRYCQQCYDLLVKEAENLSGNKRPKWIPKAGKAPENVIPVAGHQDGIMSIVEDGNFSMDIIKPTDASKPVGKRGPKHKPLPQELILQWAGEGMGSRAIASKLRNELGVKVCYRTVQRALSGDRKVVALQ